MQKAAKLPLALKSDAFGKFQRKIIISKPPNETAKPNAINVLNLHSIFFLARSFFSVLIGS